MTTPAPSEASDTVPIASPLADAAPELADGVVCSIIADEGFDDGIRSPTFPSALPAELTALGVTAEQWQAFLIGANRNVAFRWDKFCLFSLGPVLCICCFICNLQNRLVKSSMDDFCEASNAEKALGDGKVTVSSSWTTEKLIVNAGGGTGQGATIASYHHIFFHSEPAAPTMQVEMQREN